MSAQAPIPPGWYYAQGDPPGTNRYWDGVNWVGEPQFLDPNQSMATALAPATPSPWARIGARCIDGVIWFVISFVLSIGAIIDAFRVGLEGDPAAVTVSATSLVVTSVLSTAAIVAYETFLSTRGGTLGKRVTQLQVVKADGSAIDLATSFRRMLLYIAVQAFNLAVSLAYVNDPGSVVPVLTGLVFWIIALVGLVLLFTDDEGRTPWDRLGGAKVVGS